MAVRGCYQRNIFSNSLIPSDDYLIICIFQGVNDFSFVFTSCWLIYNKMLSLPKRLALLFLSRAGAMLIPMLITLNSYGITWTWWAKLQNPNGRKLQRETGVFFFPEVHAILHISLPSELTRMRMSTALSFVPYAPHPYEGSCCQGNTRSRLALA